ncbi:MAG: tRNA (adenosine(37)-N6)-dimethylallyltransferase MiaA [Tepidisphaeraceae bacterium]|jgi:tRNA dimethylallyltransferase
MTGQGFREALQFWQELSIWQVFGGGIVTDNILVILGPTGSGKSALAMRVARRVGAEILSVDAMQIYQGMDIGTAKPSLAERHEVRHHLLDWVRPDENFSVARFVALAEETIAQANGRGAKLIACGGTPLYYQSLFYGLFDGPAADARVRGKLGEFSGEVLHEKLSAVDPAAAGRIHASDRKRLIRALEVHELTGQTISSLQTQWDAAAARHAAVWVGLHWETPELNRRLNARARDMIAAGWVDEVRRLARLYPTWSQTARSATGYLELLDHLQGKQSLEDAVEKIKIATRQLARRQMKWFRRFSQVHWLPGDASEEENLEKTLRLWETGGKL